jgi:NMD protein affecting ribosome stability and mRNA decay
MEREKFYQIIDRIADDWLIDANSPIKGVFKNSKISEPTGPRRRINMHGEEIAPNETNGCVQIIKYRHWNLTCPQCGSVNKFGLVAVINLRKKSAHIEECGCNLPYFLTKKSIDV